MKLSPEFFQSFIIISQFKKTDLSIPNLGFPGGASGKKKSTCSVGDVRVQSLSWEDLLEEGMATHSSILAWRVPWTEEPGRLQSIGQQRAGQD